MKLKFVCAFLTVCLFAGALFIGENSNIPAAQENKTYNILASCFPVYALTEAITGEVPELAVQMLTLPRQEGYTEYEFSDWETAYANSADIFVCLGEGFESFDTSCLNEDCIIITLLANEDLLNKETIMNPANPNNVAPSDIYHVYLSDEGSIKLLSKLSKAFISADPKYAEMYEANLEYAVGRIESIERKEYECNKRIAIESAFAYIVNDAGIDADHVFFADDDMVLPEDTVDLRGKLDIMLDMDSSFTFKDYVNTLRENYSLLYEAVE